jgi:two-component system KDP operon response regulator KdpE
MKQKIRVLVVDDEPETIKYVSANLRARGYDVSSAEDGRLGLKFFNEHVLDLVILDVMMPGLDGFELCGAIRERSNVPIIFLSARGREKDIVRALDLGADDYLTKPFGVEEMMARVRAAIRRVDQRGGTSHPAIVIEGLHIDFGARQVTVDDQRVDLTPTEYDLLAHLAVNAGRVITHRALLQAVWGPEYGEESEYLWAYIRRLRRKLESEPREPRFIFTQPGVGYRFVST